MARLAGIVDKGWGREVIFATNDKYCGKLLEFKEGAKFSMHFHAVKDETWYVLSGEFELHTILTDNASTAMWRMVPGSQHRVKPLVPHQLVCIKAGTIIEVSTPDSVEDNYRVMKGDSQK